MSDRVRKRKHKTGIGVCGCVVAALLTAAVVLRPMDISAYEVFPGVESVVEEKISKGESYHILEIVPDGARGEMGYLAAGNEPEHFQDRLTQHLKELPEGAANTREYRLNYMNGLIRELDAAGLCGTDAPLEAEEYREEYFPTEEQQEGMHRLNFPEEAYETVMLEGAYVPNVQGTGCYRANPVSFRYSEGGDYAVEFRASVPAVDAAPYNQPYEYKSVGNYYEAVENPMEGAEYFYISEFAYVGEAAASGRYTAQLDPDMPYVYTASGDGGFDFVPGEISEEHPQNASCRVTVGHIWYEGGIINHNWFRDRILNASGKAELSIRVQTVEESRLQEADLAGVDFLYISGEGSDRGLTYGVTSEAGYARVKELYLMLRGKLPCLIDSSILENCVSSYDQSDVAKLVVWALQKDMPEDPDTADGAVLTAPEHMHEQYCGKATNYARNNIYCMATENADGVRRPFFTGLTDYSYFPDGQEGFEQVSALIDRENTLRVPEEYLDTGLTKAGVLQYIINYKNERVFTDKEELTVLDVEPAMGQLYLNADTQDDRILTRKKLAEWTGVPYENIRIVRMTSAEFIGRIEDMNTVYDMVYFGLGYADGGTGDGGDYMNRASGDGHVVYNDARMDGLVYTHTGDAFIRSPILGGLLDTEYVANDPANYLYGYMTGNGREGSNDTYGYRTHWSSSLQKLVTSPQTITNFRADRLNGGGGSMITVSVGNVGVYRSSGNDITETKRRELKEFVGARYPVVFAAGFLKEDGSVNEGRIDNSSVLYEFLQECREEENVFFLNADGVPEQEASFRYYINMPKLELHFMRPSTGEEEQENRLETGAERTIYNNYGNKIVETVGMSGGIRTMRWRFRVDSSVDATSSTRYGVKLYLDMNADGKFVSNDSYNEAQNDCLITEVGGGEADRDEKGDYILSSGREYYLEKEIPATYWGMLTWKLEIAQTSNPYIRSSRADHTIVSRPEGNTGVQVIKVLQVMGDKSNNWNLQNDGDMRGYFARLESMIGVRFEVTSIYMRDFDGRYTTLDSLRDYQMLIFGFQDSYTDMKNAQTLSAVNDFINSGRSVLFTHDTTSFVNVETPEMYRYDIATDTDTKWLAYTNGQGIQLEEHWGYHINQMFRDVLGMDRYGITYNEAVSYNPAVSQFRSALLKEGQLLDLTQQTAEDGSTVTVGSIDTANGGVITRKNPDGSGRDLSSAVLGGDKDIAYVAGSGRRQSYGETHGYTYAALNFHYFHTDGLNNDQYGETVSRYGLNRYMQWRTLPVFDWRSDESIGKLDNMYATQVNEGQITHFPYEIGNGSGQGIPIAMTHSQWWQLNMDEDIDADGQSDIVVWYCLSAEGNHKEYYKSSPNDVRNNYYIYSIGNITYSGVGDHQVWNQEEKKLFVNTIVAAYKTSIRDPEVTFLKGASRTSDECRALYVYHDGALDDRPLEAELSFYYTVSEANLVTSEKKLYADYRLKDGTALAEGDRGDGSAYVTTEAVSGERLQVLEDGRLTGLRSGRVYKVTLHNMDAPAVQELMRSGNMGITVHITSEFDYYGDSYGLSPGDHKAPETEKTLDMIRATLFDLD